MSTHEQPTVSKKPTDSLALRIILLGCGFLLIVSVAFSVGSGVGFAIGRMSNGASVQQSGTPVGSAGTIIESGRDLKQEDLKIFWEAMDLLERDYYGELPSQQERSYGAIRGVLELLDDPNTSFMPPQQARNFLESMDGSFEGIGATVDWETDLSAVRIVEPFENQPAWKAGLRRNDLIIAIDGEPVAEMADLTEAVSKIKGPRGSRVVLTIVRSNRTDPFEVEVIRDLIQIPIVFSEMVGENEDIAYIRLTRFSDNASGRLRDAIRTALDSGNVRGLIFDMRGNPGGLLREAVRVSSLFLPDKELVLIERFSDGSEDLYRAEGRPIVPADLPIVVLVNEGSASASEIVSGALQDAGRAVLLGTTTFGKGSVQLPHNLSDGSLMRVTIARWYTPKDRSIDGTGLEPDIVLELSDEEFESEEDPQLDRALQLLETGQ
ncbi:MAG: S41 family peptidase [Caldilineaceae bacterium]|nr:S41 family peptidase [Caldilineaceae bacterium]